jgi:hypothetical protein
MHWIVLLISLCLPALANASPSITFDSETHDFGTVKQGETLKYDFKFNNTGTEDLLIEKMNAT